MLKFISLNQNNLSIGQEVQKKVFPEEYQNDTLEKSLFSSPEYLSQFWLVKKGREFIGLTGIYYYPEYPQDAWLNWFGVVPKYRRHGFGRKIFGRTLAYARKLGFKTFRLYTDREQNEATLAFYRSLSMLEENYHPQKDDYTDILIFSKSCHPFKKTVTPWKNKYLYIQEQLLLSQNDMLEYIKKRTKLSLLIFIRRPSVFMRFLKMMIHQRQNRAV